MANPINEVLKNTAVEVRARAYELTLQSHHGKQVPIDAVIKDAKQIETFLWGLQAPIEHLINPFENINTAANATRDRIQEYAQNCGDAETQKKIVEAGAIWERFMSDMAAAIGDQFDGQ